VFNDFVAMKSDLRRFFMYKQLVRRSIVDIRACHPTYLGAYIYANHFNKEAVKDECDKWTSLFTDPLNDPRQVIGDEIGYTKDQCKTAINESLNGSKLYKKFHRWMKEGFPQMYQYMITHEKMGCEIAKMYEVPIMLNEDLFKHTEDMGIKLTYEYDGYSVFAKENDEFLKDRVNFIIGYIKWYSTKHFGITPVIKDKQV
jgi:hypothetical protein